MTICRASINLWNRLYIRAKYDIVCFKRTNISKVAEVEVTCDWVIYCGRLLMGVDLFIIFWSEKQQFI